MTVDPVLPSPNTNVFANPFVDAALPSAIDELPLAVTPKPNAADDNPVAVVLPPTAIDEPPSPPVQDKVPPAMSQPLLRSVAVRNRNPFAARAVN